MSKIYDVQDRLVGLLTADAYFAGIPVLSQRKGDVAAELQANLNRIGLGVLVLLPLITGEAEAIKILLTLHFVLVVSENPIINRTVPPGTGKVAEAVMEKIFQLVQFQPNGTGNAMAKHLKFQLENRAGERMEPTKAMPSLLNYMIRFRTSILIS